MIALLLLIGGPVRADVPPLSINEVLVGNASTNLDPEYVNFSGWIELRNTGGAVNLTNYTVRSLPDGATDWQVYKIPMNTSIPAGSLLLIWADELGIRTHTNFELDMDGGEIALHAPDGTLLDSIAFGAQRPDVAYGRMLDSIGDWAYFDQPTPGGPNSTTDFAVYNFAEMPTFSIPGGLHNGPQSVELSTIEAGATIRYTLDGSKPTAGSEIYQAGQPIGISQPTVIRARTFVDGKMTSPTATYTYLIDVSTTLPIVSISMDEAFLWDAKIGIYVKGSRGVLNCGVKANWHRPWQRPASIEYYEIGGDEKIRQDVGVEIHGNCSRNENRKSLEIKARKLYGDNDMDYAFFDDKPMTDYNRLILRNAGQDSTRAMLRDAMVTSLAKGQMDLDWQTYRPSIVFLNGQYWGIHDLREKMDETFVESNYGLDEAGFDMMGKNSEVMAGDTVAWNVFKNYYLKNNLADPAIYANIQTQMDVNEFMNYLIVEMYSATIDWPGPNERFWRERADDGRWRWVLYDMDSAFRKPNLSKNMFNHIPTQGGNTSGLAVRLFNNAEFRAEFAQRFAAHLNTTFAPTRVISIIDSLEAEIAPEVPNHIAHWKKPKSVPFWEFQVQGLRSFAANRTEIVRNHVRQWVGSPGTATLTINIVGDGRVMVSGAEVPSGYSGPQFRNIPITLTALPGPGTSFSHWLETGEEDSTIILPFNSDTTRTAIYEVAPLPLIVINELHHTPAPPLDDNTYEFLELYNAGDSPVNLSGFSISDAVTVTFPGGASIAPGEHIVVADTPATYLNNGYQVFDFNGGLNNGEPVTLKNNFGFTVDSVTYASAAPWPSTPNGGGPSLSLLDPSLENSLDTSWAASLDSGGSPGAVNTFAP